jgi:hypothetical protein
MTDCSSSRLGRHAGVYGRLAPGSPSAAAIPEEALNR